MGIWNPSEPHGSDINSVDVNITNNTNKKLVLFIKILSIIIYYKGDCW